MPNFEPQAAYEHNGYLVSAETFYQIACDPRRSVAVEACAGAGKTWMLVSRIVRALLDGVDGQSGQLKVQPHEILAITFTKRAASEMRERLYQWLADFAAADPQTLLTELKNRGVYGKNGMQPPSSMPIQLSNLYQSILASGRQVQVRTFHSWFAALLRSAPLAVLAQMKLPANYELLEDDAPAKALVWRRFYAALVKQADIKADFDALVFEHGRSQIEKALNTALDKRTEFALADAQGVVEQSVQHFVAQYPDFDGLTAPQDFLSAQPLRWQTLLDAAKALGGASAKTFAAKGVELEMALSQGDLPAAFAALLTEKGTPRKFGEKISGIERVRDAQALVLRVVAACQQHGAWCYQQRMTRLTRVLLQEFSALKREQGWVDMNDVEKAALVMLSDPVLSGWVQERLDARIKHLLIDEFQDTNPLQWQALRSWLSGYAGTGGGSSGADGASAPSVFIVGDPKQSIYRFRRAEPQVFKAAKAFVQDALGGDLLSCDHTRRNATGVIDTVNAAMLEATQADRYEGFRPHTTSATAPGWVCQLPPIARSARASAGAASTAEGEWRDSLTTPREIPEETLRTLEARQAAQWIAQQLLDVTAPESALQPSDVMVLSRKRAGLLPLQQELRKLNIAAQIGEKTQLIDCCEVQDIVALLDVLVSPQHDLSLAQVLKSPLFSLDDTALVQLALQQRETPLSWFDLLQKTELSTHDGRALAPIFLQWKRWLDALPPHDALQAIYFDGDVLARFARAAPSNQRDTVLANLRALLGVALQLGGGRFATPYAFVRALKAGGVLAPATVNPLAVRLLTIHGAKGLEAKAVLLLDTDTPERNADSMGVLVDWPGEAAWPQKFVFLISENTPPACAVTTLEAEWLERQREELNALYVALTRARHTLAISSIEPYRAAERSWWQRLSMLATPVTLQDFSIPALMSDVQELTQFYIKELPETPVEYAQEAIKIIALSDRIAGRPVGRADPSDVTRPRPGVAMGSVVGLRLANPSDKALPLEQITPPTASAAGAAEEPDASVARIGQAMHRLLEWGEVSVSHIAAVLREYELSPEQSVQAAAMAECILQGEGAWAWDASMLAWQGNEVELMVEGALLRLDRLVQRKDNDNAGHWWVLDYKSAHAPHKQPELVAQLRSYQAAVQSIYPNAMVKAAFLTAQGDLIELVNGCEPVPARR